MKKALTVAILATAGIAASANANLLAYWNFNNSTPQSGAGTLGVLNSTAANAGVYAGTASLSLSSNLNFNTTATTIANGDVGTFSGTTLSAIPADAATTPGGALAVRGSVSGATAPGSADNNGEYVQFSLSTLGYSGISIVFDGRGTSSGFGSVAAPNRVLVSTDGVNFSQLATYTSTQTSFQTYSFTAGSFADNKATFIVRLQLFGATTGTGNNRIDNFQVVAAIPTPGSLAIVGMAGLIAARRRRA